MQGGSLSSGDLKAGCLESLHYCLPDGNTTAGDRIFFYLK
jgi:hypothetical protein